jgi:hypothetical protein
MAPTSRGAGGSRAVAGGGTGARGAARGRGVASPRRAVRRYNIGGDLFRFRYGQPLHCAIDTEIGVYSSAAAGRPMAWLKLQSLAMFGDERGESHASLDVKTVKELIRRLQTWVDEQGRGR